MNQRDFADFRALLQGVHDFYGKDLTHFAMDVWWNALQQFELDTLRQAFSMHCVNPDTGQFCPRPADVVRMLGGTTKDSAIAAWNKVQAAVSAAGAYRSVCFDDQIINRVLSDMGGWPQHCQKSEDELPFVERNFCDRYRAYRTRGLDTYPGYLIGMSEAQNALNGFRSEDPALIGNKQAALVVLRSGNTTAIIPVTLGQHSEVVAKLLNDRTAH